jgi:uncharacterized protein (DUF2147 family)
MEVAMKIHSMLAIMSMASALALPAVPAWASSGPVGSWRVANGKAVIDIKPCGDNLCGFVASDRNSDSFVGQQVFIDMRPEGDDWSGTIVDLASGQRYAGKISLLDDNRLSVEGCILGGFFCGGQQWSRVD